MGSKNERRKGMPLDEPAGKTVVVPVETYCISTKSISPPPAAGLKYTAGKYPDSGIYTTLVRIAQTAQKLNQEGRFNDRLSRLGITTLDKE